MYTASFFLRGKRNLLKKLKGNAITWRVSGDIVQLARIFVKYRVFEKGSWWRCGESFMNNCNRIRNWRAARRHVAHLLCDPEQDNCERATPPLAHILSTAEFLIMSTYTPTNAVFLWIYAWLDANARARLITTSDACVQRREIRVSHARNYTMRVVLLKRD